jgi:threonyl-tRNA synthetase
MRFLSFHVDYFWYKVSQRGRSGVVEEIDNTNKERRVENALVLFISTEKRDEANPGVETRVVAEIEKITTQLKVTTVVINPYAHLFGELSSLDYALKVLKDIASILEAKGYVVVRIPFGWFNELEMRAKGHPLSRIARMIE